MRFSFYVLPLELSDVIELFDFLSRNALFLIIHQLFYVSSH
jgi:hypothetical protein